MCVKEREKERVRRRGKESHVYMCREIRYRCTPRNRCTSRYRCTPIPGENILQNNVDEGERETW